MKTHPKIHNESKTKHGVYSRYNKQVSKAIVALTFSLLGESTHAVLPEDTTGGGDFVTENIQFCNYSRVIIGKTEGILTASHCINKKTKKDLVYFHGNALLNPEITKRFHQLPSLKISEISENNLIGEKVYIPGHLEDKDGNKQYFTLAGNALKDIQNGFFFIKMKEDELINANKRLNKTQPIWKGLSGSPVILSHNDTIVGIVSEATKDGKYIYFSGPENLKLLRSLIESK